VSWLKREAKARGTSVAGVIRELIRDAAERKPKRPHPYNERPVQF